MKIAAGDSGLSSNAEIFPVLRGLLEAVRAGSPLLYGLGWAHFILAMLLVPGLLLDERLILGVNPWLKPLKFALSIGIYLWTFAWYLNHLRHMGRRRGVLVWTVSITMLIEIFVIVLQSALGTTSHYNTSTLFNAVLWEAMGQAIAVNTLANIYLLYLFMRRKFSGAMPASSSLLLWGLRLGLFLFILGALEGGVMASLNRHTMGAADGGPGLPLVNWSTRAGDLRIAHFLGLHAMQLIPLFAWFLYSRGVRRAWPGVVFACGYFALTSALFLQALLGRPLIAY